MTGGRGSGKPGSTTSNLTSIRAPSPWSSSSIPRTGFNSTVSGRGGVAGLSSPASGSGGVTGLSSPFSASLSTDPGKLLRLVLAPRPSTAFCPCSHCLGLGLLPCSFGEARLFCHSSRLSHARSRGRDQRLRGERWSYSYGSLVGRTGESTSPSSKSASSEVAAASATADDAGSGGVGSS
jgi:hypothetical protein